MIKKFLKTALATALFAVAGVQTAGAQEVTYLTNPETLPSGYYYVVSSYNDNYAWAINGDKEFVVDELDETDVKFIFYVTGRNTDSETTKKQDNVTVANLGTQLRVRMFWGTPAWTDFSSDPKVFWTLGGLGANSNQQLLNVNAEYGMHNWQNVTDAGFRFNASNRGYNIAPQNGTFAKRQKLWYYANNTYNDQGRWKFKAVSAAQITAVEATTPEVVIARLQAEEAVPNAIAAFAELTAVAANIGTAVGEYNYEPTTEEQNLINGAYDEESTYSGMSLSEINALITSFAELTAAIKAAYVWPNVSIVTLQFNGQNRYSGWNNSNSTGNQWNDLGSPNGVNGRIALLKQSDGKFVISSQGLYLKNTQQSTFNLADATKFTMTGSFDDGLTFQAEDGNYLTGSKFAVSATEPTNKYKVNTFNMYTKVSDTDGYVTDGNGNYANALCYPVRVKKPGENYHMYTVKVVDGALQTTEVNEVPAGVPFIYVRPNNDNNDGDRLIIDQDNQEYAATPATDYLLQGFYLQDQKEDAKFYFGVKDNVFGFYTDVQLGTATNRAYITAASAADLDGAKMFQLIDGELVVTQTHEVTYQLEDANGNKLADDVVIEDAVHGSAPAAPAAFEAGYVTLTKTSGPDAINADATIVYTATWNALPFELDKEYNLAFRPNDVRFASTEQNANNNYLVQPNTTDYKRTLDAYQWKLTGNPYAIQVVAKDGGVVTLSDESNYATLEEDGTFTFTLVRVDDTTFRLQANGLTVTNGQIYLADYQNPGKLGRYTADDGTKIQVADIPTAPETVALTVTEAGYATFTSEWPLDFSTVSTVKAYRAVKNENLIDFMQVTTVPAEEGLLIKGSFDTEVTANIPVAATTPAAIENEFVGTLVNLLLTEGDYVLYQTSFYKVGTTDVTLPAGKAYIPASVGANARIAKLDFDEATGIQSIDNGKLTIDNVYNLQGVRVAQPTKGLYIVNGKKMVVK